MDNLVPLSREPSSSEPMRRLLRAARRPVPVSAERHAQAVRRFEARVAAAHARSRRRVALGLAAGAVAALALFAVPPRLAPPLPVGPSAGAEIAPSPAWDLFEQTDLGLLESSRGPLTLVEAAAERQIRFDYGLLRAQIRHQDPGRPVVVVTPHLRVVVVGTRFDLQVDAEATSVFVLEGQVRVEALGAGAAFVSGGEWINSNDQRLAAPPPPTVPHRAARATPPPRVRAARPPPASSDCGALDAPARRIRCWERLAQGRDMAAQNALFALGRHALEVERDPARAHAHWRAYLERFPAGVLAPEVSLSLFEMLRAQGRREEALAAGAWFEARYGDDPRADAVALSRAELLCDRPDDLRPVLDALRHSPRAHIRQAAEESRIRCGLAQDALAPDAASRREATGPPP